MEVYITWLIIEEIILYDRAYRKSMLITQTDSAIKYLSISDYSRNNWVNFQHQVDAEKLAKLSAAQELLWTTFWTIFGPFFVDHFIRGGERSLVLREGWDAVYSTQGGVVGRLLLLGERWRTNYVRAQGGVGGWRIGNCCWFMECLLNHANYFVRFFDWTLVSKSWRWAVVFL